MCKNDEFDLSYGLKDGKLVFIDEVDRGLECGCFCPHCGGKLIAKKGEVNLHHFAHYQVENCGKGAESVLHLLGKQVLLEEQCIRLPNGSSIELLTSVEVERRRLGYVADIGAVIVDTGEDIDLEIKVTHGIGTAKLAKVLANKVKMVEVDLSGLLGSGTLTKEKVRQAVLTDAPRVWVCESHFSETECKESEMNNKNLVCGYRVVTGYSQKNQDNFEFAALYILVKQEGRSSPNYQIQGMGGYEQTTVPMKMHGALLEKLDRLSFPISAELVFDMSLIKGKLKPVVSDVIV